MWKVLSVVSTLLALATTSVASADDAEEGAESSGWFVSQLTGDWRTWLPEEDFSPEPPESHHMVIYEVTQNPYDEPTPEQREAAERLVEQSIEAARRNGWFRFEQALEDGYEPMVDDRAHYAHREYVTDGRVLDPERPEFLMFYDTRNGKKLVGAMYLMSDLYAHGPQIGGPATVWHYHLWSHERCLWEGLLALGPVDDQGECAEGVPSARSAEMIHVWFVDHPGGPFTTNMALPPSVLRELEERTY